MRRGRSGRRGLAVVALLASSGCGYTLVGRASNLPPEVRTVYLAAFKNETQRIGVDQILGRAVADELVGRPRLEVVSSAETADAIIEGTVSSFTLVPVSFDAEGRASEYEVLITANLAFKRRDPEAVIWANDRYAFRDSFPVESAEVGLLDQETRAIEATADKFAETVVTDLLEGF